MFIGKWIPNNDTTDKHTMEIMPMYLFLIIKNTIGAANEKIIKSNTNQNGLLQP